MQSAVVLAALLSIADGAVNYCGAKMCGRTNGHTFCQYLPGPSPLCSGYIEDHLTHDERARVLARLNRRRNEVAAGRLPRLPSAGNMLKLHWVEELAREAQLWADQCRPPATPEEHDGCRDLFSITVGQSVASVVGEAPGLRPESMVDTWYLQGLQYKGNVSSYTNSDKHDDFGQMMWAHTFMVGCARSRFMSEINDRTRTVIRLVCNFAPRGPAGELWLPAAPAAACPKHTRPQPDLPALCAQQNNTSDIDELSTEMTLEERIVLNAVLQIERNESLEHRGSLDEIYLTNMAIATLNHPTTTESYSKSKHELDILEPIFLEDDKQIDKASNSVQTLDETIAKLVREKLPAKVTKLEKKVSIVGRPKSYNIEDLNDQEGNANTRSVETTTLKERDTYAEYEFQDISEISEYDDNATAFDNVETSTSKLNSTENDTSTVTPSPLNAVVDNLTLEANVTNHDLLRLLELSKMTEEFPSNPQAARELQDALEHMERALAGDGEMLQKGTGKVRRELKRRPQKPDQQATFDDMNHEENPEEDTRASNPSQDFGPIKTLEKTPSFKMLLKYIPFVKDYETLLSSTSRISPCVFMIVVSVFVRLGLM